MKMTNYTTVPDETLRRIIKFARPTGVTGFKITFRNCSFGYCGVAHYTNGARAAEAGPGTGNRAQPRPYVLIGVYGPLQKVKWRMPYYWMGTDEGLDVRAYSNIEAVVFLVAHELRHVWQGRVKRGHRVWGARGQYCERDADAYGLRVLRRWRRETRGTTPFSGG